MQISYLKYRLTSCTLLAPTSLFPKSKFRSPYCLQHILPSASPTSASASLLLQGLRPALTLPIPWKNRSQHCPGRCKPHGRRKPAAFTQLWITLRYPAHHNRAWVTGWYIAAWRRAARLLLLPLGNGRNWGWGFNLAHAHTHIFTTWRATAPPLHAWGWNPSRNFQAQASQLCRQYSVVSQFN